MDLNTEVSECSAGRLPGTVIARRLRMPQLGCWPEANGCCIVLTHDVESPNGLAAVERMAALEERYGFRSAWNLVLE
jgi:hypothetical protein